MRIVSIWDIHWKDIRKKIVEKEKDADKIIFMWDYLDSFTIDIETQIQNFKEIVEFKRKNPKQVVLLFGNHDFHYWSDMEQYSWYSSITKMQVKDIYKELIANYEIELMYRIENNVYSHAWISVDWLASYFDFDYEKWILEFEWTDLGELELLLIFSPSDMYWYWEDKYQSPIWIRPMALMNNIPEWYNMIVGHTRVHDIEIFDDLILTDCLDNNNHYLINEDWEFTIGAV